jgi:hypothetical protein
MKRRTQLGLEKDFLSVFYIRIGLDADPAFYLDTDSDPGFAIKLVDYAILYYLF